jgi:hypothetical protein
MPIGVEKELYRAIDCAAKQKDIQRLLVSVAANDQHAQEMARISGYHQIAAKTLGAQIRKALATEDREEVFYEKLL